MAAVPFSLMATAGEAGCSKQITRLVNEDKESKTAVRKESWTRSPEGIAWEEEAKTDAGEDVTPKDRIIVNKIMKRLAGTVKRITEGRKHTAYPQGIPNGISAWIACLSLRSVCLLGPTCTDYECQEIKTHGCTLCKIAGVDDDDHFPITPSECPVLKTLELGTGDVLEDFDMLHRALHYMYGPTHKDEWFKREHTRCDVLPVEFRNEQ